jgi:glycolate oxidase iron-sulfur subunit
MSSWGEVLLEVERCLYCGFCEPLCPTLHHGPHRGYGPRGRVAVIRMLAEAKLEPTPAALEAIYTCLLCRRCEAACPPGISIPDIVRKTRSLLNAGTPPRTESTG